MLRRLPRALVVCALVAGGLVATSGTALADLPDRDQWGPQIEGYTGWDDRASDCISGARPGVEEFEALVREELDLDSPWATNIPRDCQGGGSEHEEGRALDIMLHADNPSERAKADRLLDWMLATDRHGNEHAMARRLGVMYIIYDGRIWESNDKWGDEPGWASYGSSDHDDHIHISFDWPGARGETSFFDPPPPSPPCEPGWDAGATGGGIAVERAGGCDRYETSALLARDAGSADTVYVATGEDYSDALAATPAAAADDAPVLLTPSDALHPAASEALDALDPARIVVLGGEGAVSEDVESQLEAHGEVDRVGGETRWETAAELAELAPSDAAAYLASGAGFADALSGGAAAGHEGRPLLLTRPDELVGETAATVDELAPERLVALGGSAAVGQDTLQAAAERVGAEHERREGNNRWKTSATIAKQSFAATETDTVVLASGEGFADALSAAALAANEGAPLLLTPSHRLANAAEAQIERLSPSRIVVAGGASAIDERVLTAARQAAGG